MRYGPPTRKPVIENWPVADVVPVWVDPVRVSVTRTLAPAAGLPSGRLMVPRIAEVVSCANPATGIARHSTAASQAQAATGSNARLRSAVSIVCFMDDPRIQEMTRARLAQACDGLVSLEMELLEAPPRAGSLV